MFIFATLQYIVYCSATQMPDAFWYNDITVLYNNPTAVVPSSSQTVNEKLNSVTRLGIYMGVILAIFHQNPKYLYITVVTIFIILYLKYSSDYRNVDTIANIGGRVCTVPTKDNPFMNATMGDYMNIDPTTKKIVDRPPACDVTDPRVKAQINEKFNEGLFRDIDDVFNRLNSQRQFYTTASTTIPNDREAFINWIGKRGPSCKEDPNACQVHEDPRLLRPIQ